MQKKVLLVLSLFILPLSTFAQTGTTGNLSSLVSLVVALKGIVGGLIPVFIGLALLFFIWNAVKLIRAPEEKDREEAKKGIWWAIIAMFCAVGIWGIISFIGTQIGITPTNGIPAVPSI